MNLKMPPKPSLAVQSVGSNSSGGTGWSNAQNKLSECFELFINEFQTQIDFYFKTYNKNLRESVIENQLTKGVASKKEQRIKHQAFLIHEECLFWSEFPRKLEFYNDYLRRMSELFVERSAQSGGSTVVSLIVTSILNVLPIASKKYCYRFGQDPVFHQDTGNNKTFDSLTEQQKMFDADDLRNWRILGFAVTIFASDLILILLEQSTEVQISAGVVSILLDVCQYYSIVQVFNEDEEIEEESVLDIYFKQIQVTWAKIFGNLSKMSFDKCSKLMLNSLNQDFRKLKEEEIQSSAQRIYFCRFLKIDPVDAEKAFKVQALFNDMNKLLADKNTTPQMKNVLMMTLKFLIEQLQYHGEANAQSNVKFMRSILWPVIEQLFALTEKCRKKEALKDYAIHLQIVIMKVSPQEFFNEKMTLFLNSKKLLSYFESKKTYKTGLQLVIELSCLRAIPFNRHQDWNPNTEPRQFLLVEDKTKDVVLPIKHYKSQLKIKGMRRLANDQLPLPFRYSFSLVFNPKALNELSKWHYFYLQHMAFEDLEFTCSTAIPTLLSTLKNQERYDLPLLGFKMIDFILNPIHDFKSQFLRLQPQSQTLYEEIILSLHTQAQVVIREILRSQILKSDFLVDLSNFYKLESDQQLCTDQLGMMWTIENNGDMEHVFKRSSQISQNLKSRKLAHFHLQEEKRVISYEEFKEIHHKGAEDAEYQNEQLNVVARGIAKELKDWDFKKEKFTRHRIASYLSEDRKEGQRQNQTQYSLAPQKKEEQLLLRQIVKMIHFLPEVQDLFKFFPTNRLLVNQGDIMAKASDMNFPDFQVESEEEEVKLRKFLILSNPSLASLSDDKSLSGGFGQQPGQFVKTRRKSGTMQKSYHENPVLKECQNILPYLLLNADYEIVTTTSRELQRLIVYGDFQAKIAIVDQMIYLVKELMLNAPQEFHVVQTLQQLIKMIKIWHTSEKNKIKISEKAMQAKSLDGMEIIWLDPQASEKKSVDVGKRMIKFQYIFECIDMLALIGCNSKDRLVRQNSIILMAENGKLKRLLIPKDSYTRGLYDVIYYGLDDIKDLIASQLLVFNPFKQGELKSRQEITRLVGDLSPYQLIVDNFDYKKAGVNEGLVRDLQSLWMCQIFLQWRKILIQSSSKQIASISLLIIKFIKTLCLRTLMIFEKQNEVQMASEKDYVGLNLLMALSLFIVARPISEKQESDDGIIQKELGIQDELPSLIKLVKGSKLSDVFKFDFAKFYPSRFSMSTLFLSLLFVLETDQPSNSTFLMLREIFPLSTKKKGKVTSADVNSLVFYSLVMLDSKPTIMRHLGEDLNLMHDLAVFLPNYEAYLEQTEEPKLAKMLFITFLHGLILAIDEIFGPSHPLEIERLISGKKQYQILLLTKQIHDEIEEGCKEEMGDPLLNKIKVIWQKILSFEMIFKAEKNIKLDLRFLISMEQQGLKVLRHYKYLCNNNPNQVMVDGKLAFDLESSMTSMQEGVQQEFSVNELKHLLNYIYQFYRPDSNINELLMQINPYYECFASNIVGAKVLLHFLKSKNFNQVYGQLTSSCLRSNKLLIEAKIKQFISYGLHSKYFLVGLFMALNSLDAEIVTHSKIICLSVLPLLFEDERFRESVESAISEHQDLEGLVSHDNKQFFRFIKQVFRDEEQYNMRNHFEKYFSVSGMLRCILNEIIKLQSTLQFSQEMLLKIMDILTYFLGSLQLRRAPIIEERNSSFIFDNMIDYKSFELLGKLYKVTEKLVDYDEDSLVVNLWFKVVDQNLHNFEILAKFLVHNLSSFIMKLRLQNNKDGQSDEKRGLEYSEEYEKQKRFSLSIFNYIKARVQQVDLRNSINISANSITWSQKMIKLVQRASLNLQSKYVLEKIKLKKLLQLLHQEINEGGVRLQLKGGIIPSGAPEARNSLSMHDLLSSQTFLATFAARNRQSESIMKNLLFRVRKIMNQKFNEVAGAKSVEQMPELIIKYMENALVFVSNDVERPTQQINFTPKEQLTVVIVIIVLTLDLIIRDSNKYRYFFLFEVFKKLSLHIPLVRKYISLENFTSELLKKSGKESITAKIWQVVNLKPSIDNFALFTKLYFKIAQNVSSSPMVQYYMIKLWLQTFQKHREGQQLSPHQMSNSSSIASIAEIMKMKTAEAHLYSRNLILSLIQNQFFNIFEVAQEAKACSSQELKYSAYNFKQHFQCVVEYVMGPQTAQGSKHLITSSTDPESVHVAFATNAIFWIAYSCIECSSLMTDETLMDLGSELQVIGMQAITKVLEKSDFLKMLIGVTKLSPNFFSYSISMSKGESCFLQCIFDAIENPLCAEDAFKSLLITIRVQDYQLLNASNKRDFAELELQRLLYLIPFLMQQFSYILNQQMNPSNRGKQPIFANHRSIILLLKKSLPSIGIDKKKDVFEQLDVLQREVEKIDSEKLVRKTFESLFQATVQLCFQMGYQQVIFDCESTFFTLKEDLSSQKREPTIDLDKLDMVLKVINEFIVANSLEQLDETARSMIKHQTQHEMTEKVYSGEILGEEASVIREQFRPLYFGLKNIVLKEIESIDQEIDIQKFFFDSFSEKREERASLPIPALIKSQLMGSPRTNTDNNYENHGEADFSNVVIKMTSIRRQETTSKYQNSMAASQIYATPTEKIIREILNRQPVSGTNNEQVANQGGVSSQDRSVPVSLQQRREAASVKSFNERLSPKSTQYQPQLIQRILTQQYSNYSNNTSSNQPRQDEMNVEDSSLELHQRVSISSQRSKAQNSQRQEVSNEEISDHITYMDQTDEKFEVVHEQETSQVHHQPSKKDSYFEFQDQSPKMVSAHPQMSRSPNLIEKVEMLPPILTKHATSFQDKINQSKNIVYQGDEGGIVTFSKPKAPQLQQQSEKPLTKTFAAHEIAINPNYVAERTSRLFNELYHQTEFAQTEQNFYQPGAFAEPQLMRNTSSKSITPQYGFMNQSRERTPVRKQEGLSDMQITSKATNFFDSIKNEELPTPKKGHQATELESVLVTYLSNKKTFIAFERFLNERHYDIDYLHFYVKVMEFKQETHLQKAVLIAGQIIDTYLSDSAPNYIPIETKQVERVMSSYTRLLDQRGDSRSNDIDLFGGCTSQIEEDLSGYVCLFQNP